MIPTGSSTEALISPFTSSATNCQRARIASIIEFFRLQDAPAGPKAESTRQVVFIVSANSSKLSEVKMDDLIIEI